MLLTIERVLFLRKVEMFANIDEDALVELASAMQEREFSAGATIIREGDPGRELFIVVRGEVRVVKGDHELATLGSQGVFGELAALDPQPRSASVVALGECHLLQLDHAVLFEELMNNNVLARGLIRFLVNRVRERH